MDFVPPTCPPVLVLREMLEIAYIAAGAPEEGRYARFNLAATPLFAAGDPNNVGELTRFDQPRGFSVAEVRRLAPALDANRSAVWVEWEKSKWQISGLADFGPYWRDAMLGVRFNYNAPECLVVRVERPGRLLIHMSGVHVATLSDGDVKGWGRKFVGALFGLARTSARDMSTEFERPSFRRKENLSNAVTYEEMSLWNTYAGIANLISVGGHGGAIIIVPSVPRSHLTQCA